jgi:hypothetical protein
MPFNVNGNILSNTLVKLYNETTIVRSGLVLYLNANVAASYPGSGTSWTDLSTNSRVSTLSGYGGGSTPTYSTLGGGSILFNRSSTLANSAAVFSLSTGGTTWADLTSTVSLSIWFYTGTSSVMILAGKGFRTSPSPQEFQAYQFYTNGDSIIGRITAGGATSNVDVSTSFSYNTWTNVVLTYDGSTASVYKDGLLANSASKTGSITNILSLPFIVGAQYNANNGYNLPTDGFNGWIGQVLLYNKALTAAEVLQNFNATRKPYLAVSSYAFYISNGQGSSCTGDSYPNLVYGNNSTFLTSTRYFTDAGLTTPFNGGGSWYKDSTFESGTTVTIDSSGYQTSQSAC